MHPARPFVSYRFISYRIVCAIIFSALFLSGCSQKFQNVSDTFRLAVKGEPDTLKPQSWIEQLPYASMYARIGDGPQAFMVLALAEHPVRFQTTPTASTLQLKWLAADKGMLVTEHGRLVKTLNLPQGNLRHVEATSPDPVALGLQKPSTPKHWQRRIDWQPGNHFGYQLISNFKDHGLDSISINGILHVTRYFVESVEVPSLNLSFENEFWIHPENGQVFMSRQHIAPGLPVLETQRLKPYGN
ncbi:YjbF family lipoprotein [Photobacterium galatheae]|uniref:YjbF family lipoprotein n=1 Tax=Photobacterium galatheae TaxID=1654360 RepID=UPI00202CFA19|nr:YjbF family lipoprotein [Photobacterium galatheae]MCM0147584.1 YjbF family lipoprotein [Photobacterium galatheae]